MINHIILFSIQLIHWIFLVLIGVSVPLLLICEPFYFYSIVYLDNSSPFSRVLDCPWTRLENQFRSRLGKPEIGGFISHYIKQPLRRKKWTRDLLEQKDFVPPEIKDIEITLSR